MRFAFLVLSIGYFTLYSVSYSQSSLGFSGFDSYVQIADESSLRLQQFTLECWIQIKGNGIAVHTGTEGVNAIPIIAKGMEDPALVSGINYFLGIRTPDHVLVFDYELSESANTPFLNQPVFGVTPLKNNYWYHIAVTYDGNVVSIFLNGKLETMFETLGLPLINVQSDLGIATTFDKYNNPNGKFEGIIDALRIWNINLSQEQLLQNINAEITSSAAGLVLALNFNEGAGINTIPVGQFLSDNVLLINTTWGQGAPFEVMIPPFINEEKIMSIGLITDPQYCDCPEGTLRKYRLSLEKLSVAIDTINSRNVNFTVTLGDVIDRYYISYDSILPLYNTVNNPKYFLLGNHEFDSVEDPLKDEILGRLNMPDYYYDIEYNNWKFLFLDGTEMAEYTSVLHPELTAEADSMRERVTGWVNDHIWNGGVSRNQLSWIEQHLASSLANNQHVVLFCHWPVFPFNTRKNLWNDTAVVSLIEEYPNVIAYIDGHNHAGNYGVRNGIHYVNQIAMVETEEYNSFQILDIFPDKLVFDGFGMNKDKVLNIKDNFKVIPVPTLSDNTLHYNQSPGAYLGRFEGKSNKSNIFLIGDTSFYDNNYFMLINDSVFLKSVPDYNQQNRFKIKLGIIDNVFDTLSMNYTFEFSPIVFVRKRDLSDTLISVHDDYIISYSSIVSDYSKYGLSYELDIEDEGILSGNISDTSLSLSPLRYGRSQIILHLFDTYTKEASSDTFNVTVYDPDNISPAHLNIRKILFPTEDTLTILLDTLFYDANNDPLFYEIENYLDPMIHLNQPENNLLQIWSESTIDTLLTITCTDNRGGFDTLQLPFLFNNPPTQVSDVAQILLFKNQSYSILLDTLFSDSENDLLTFNYSIVDSEICFAEMHSGYIELKAVNYGETQLNINASDASGASAQLTLEIIVGISLSNETESGISDEFLIFPNPSSELINIHFTAFPNTNYRLILFDHIGHIRGEVDYNSSEKSIQQLNLSIPNLSPGTYFLHILDKKILLHSRKILIL